MPDYIADIGQLRNLLQNMWVRDHTTDNPNDPLANDAPIMNLIVSPTAPNTLRFFNTFALYYFQDKEGNHFKINSATHTDNVSLYRYNGSHII